MHNNMYRGDSMFALDSSLNHQCFHIGNFPLSRLLLVNDVTYPWCILVPERENVREIFQLTGKDQQQLIKESSLLARNLAELLHADKMNIAALGNSVPQLHVHHIVRYVRDPAWPQPVWGKTTPVPYNDEQRGMVIRTLKSGLGKHCAFVD